MINKEYLTKAKQREIIKEWEEGEEIKDIADNIQEPTKLVNDFLKNIWFIIYKKIVNKIMT